MADPQPTENPPPVDPEDRWLAALLFGGLFLVTLVLVIGFERDPFQHPSPGVPFTETGRLTHAQIMQGLMVFSGLGAAGVLLWGLVRRFPRWHRPPLSRLVKGVLIAAVAISGFSYLYARRGMMEDHYAHRYDTYHYMLATRYYAEMGYADLYACTLAVIGPDIVPDSARARDLTTYRMVTAGEIRADNPCPRENFAPERWARWVADLTVFANTPGGHGILNRVIRDRGYNGTPFHAAVSGWAVDKVLLTIATHNLLPLLDVAMISLMLWAATAAFGWKIGLLFALSVFTIAADRWGIIGGSWFRYGWFLTLTLGIVMLRLGRFAWAGVFMALATALNVFPAVFAVGVLVRGAAASWEARRLLPRYRNFVLAGLVTGLLAIGIGALPARGFDNYAGWWANMTHHNAERFQGFGTGLKFPFVYRGANSFAEDDVPERVRREQFHENRIAFYPLAALLIGLSLAVSWRTRDDAEAAAITGFTLFFCLLGTVGYYFAAASLVILGLHRRAGSPGGTILLSLWFLTSLLAHWALYETGYARFMYNTVLSLGWTLWLTALLVWLAAKEGILREAARLIAAPARSA